MKKTYLMPVMRDLSMYEEEMIAASVEGFDGSMNNTAVDPSGILSRESAWDDED
jgi:hypothetical protein